MPTMKARCLTVMGTRAQDQHLVARVADRYGVKSSSPENWKREECMIPSFGWHPWFAHMMYLDDPSREEEPRKGETGDQGELQPLQGSAKIAHYQSVLAPHRSDPLCEEDKEVYLSLPDPTPFTTFLAQTRKNLLRYPHALVGEIGLDRSFRIPEAPSPSSQTTSDTQQSPRITPGSREGRRLTPFRCAPAHQKAIFKLQLQLAAETGRAVSVHGVQAHGLVYETIRELWVGYEVPVLSKRERKRRGKDDPSVRAEMDGVGKDGAERNEKENKGKPYPPRVCLHSFSGSPSTLKQYLDPAIPVSFFMSFSTAINLGDTLLDEDTQTPQAFIDVISACPDDMLLVESDLHTAGEEMDRRLEDIVRRVCGVKGWGLEEGVRKLGANWRRFVCGEQ